MNQKEIQIRSIRIGDDYYVTYSDTDAQIDYFHGSTMSQKRVIEKIREYSSDYIMVYGYGDDEDSEQYKRRLNKLAKVNRYKIVEKDNRTFLVL